MTSLASSAVGPGEVRNLGAAGRAGIAALAAALGLAGCNVAPATYRVRADASARMAGPGQVAIAPVDVEVKEINAAGVLTARDDWSEQVGQNVMQGFAAVSGFRPAPALGPAELEQLSEVQPLMRAIMTDNLEAAFGFMQIPGSRNRPLTYGVGAVDALAAGCGAPSLLFVFVRDSYSSSSRQALVALGMTQRAPLLASAALVSRDGSLLWINYHGDLFLDLRKADDARKLAEALLQGLPTR